MPRAQQPAKLSTHSKRSTPATLVVETACVEDPIASARSAGLRYVNDAMPGVRRLRAGKGFRYIGPDGAAIRDKQELQRIAALAIPPAWTDVWICANPRGHIQATGRDAKGRKQYRYHPRWRSVRDETKYHRTLAFGLALPGLRERTAKALALPGMPREKILATVAQLLDKTLIRVGNEEYSRENASFGLTTLQNEHVEVSGATIRFEFRGKSGKYHSIAIRSPRLARIIGRCQEMPGYELFQYTDEQGERHSIESNDVNDYLRDLTGQDFTAKDFRTWGGTVIAAQALVALGVGETETEAKRRIVEAIKTTAERLGNTPAICRKSYVHPVVVDAYMDGTLERLAHEPMVQSSGLRPEEQLVLALLQQAEAQAQADATETKAG
jgi:DNA topoisomerase-1